MLQNGFQMLYQQGGQIVWKICQKGLVWGHFDETKSPFVTSSLPWERNSSTCDACWRVFPADKFQLSWPMSVSVEHYMFELSLNPYDNWSWLLYWLLLSLSLPRYSFYIAKAITDDLMPSPRNLSSFQALLTIRWHRFSY